MKVAILGCGPSGMFAAHAAVEEGHDVRIFSKPRKSFMRGAQYLHEPIPGLSEDPFSIDYRIKGSVDGYREKVYGPGSEVEVSPETLIGVHSAWDIREAYDAAWDRYSGLILPWDAQKDWIPQTFDLVFSTIPATLLCSSMDKSELTTEEELEAAKCKFSSETILSTSKAPHPLGEEDNVVLCSGGDDFWYRAARIHGWETTEYPMSIIKRFPREVLFGDDLVHEVVKPISTTCICRPEIIRSGRYGKWTKGVLSHESYFDMKEVLR